MNNRVVKRFPYKEKIGKLQLVRKAYLSALTVRSWVKNEKLEEAREEAGEVVETISNKDACKCT